MVWGAIIGAGIALYGQSKQKKAQDEANSANYAQTAEGQRILGQGKADALAAQRRGITFADEAFEKAAGLAGTVGQASKSQVLRRETQYRGAADARAANRGLYNSTSALNDQRGVYESTNQTLAGIDESVAQLLSQIQQSRGAIALQGQQGLASIYQNFASMQAGMATSLTHQANPNIAKGYGNLGMGLGQMLMQYKFGLPGGSEQGSGFFDDFDSSGGAPELFY